MKCYAFRFNSFSQLTPEFKMLYTKSVCHETGKVRPTNITFPYTKKLSYAKNLIALPQTPQNWCHMETEIREKKNCPIFYNDRQNNKAHFA
jgi:hypothetical protein